LTQLPNTQKLEQPPQWVGSVSMFTQTPWQQVSPLAHLCPHAPQLLASVPVSEHTPPQQAE
jgi:hypothetical protein